MWTRVTKASPCPVCGKEKWCSIGDRAIWCMKGGDPPAGMRLVRATDKGHLFREERHGKNEVPSSPRQ